MWRLAEFLMVALEEYGFQVTTTRPDITDNPELWERGAAAKGSAMFISLHSNAPGSAADTATTGTVVYYSLTNPYSKPLADQLGNAVAALMGHQFRGSFTKQYSDEQPNLDYFAVIRASAAAGCKNAVLIEHGFHTNPKDAAFLANDAGLKKLATAEAKIIADWYDLGQTELEKNKAIVKAKCGFDDSTITYLAKHPYPEALFEKLVNALK